MQDRHLNFPFLGPEAPRLVLPVPQTQRCGFDVCSVGAIIPWIFRNSSEFALICRVAGMLPGLPQPYVREKSLRPTARCNSLPSNSSRIVTVLGEGVLQLRHRPKKGGKGPKGFTGERQTKNYK